MVRLNWFVRQKVLGANIHEREGLLERNIAPHIYTGHVSHIYTSNITNIYESSDTYAYVTSHLIVRALSSCGSMPTIADIAYCCCFYRCALCC